MKKAGTIRSTAAGSLLMLAMQPLLAEAQSSPKPSAQSSAQPSIVEQVLVTARKRSEDSSQVPISMNVVDGSTIESLHLRTLPELVSQTQNVSMFEDFPGAGIPTWVIRGVGLQDFNSNNTPTAAVFADGVYQVATVMGDLGLFDIDQVEMLKGPQGGLYGRNTTGGAVRLDSHRAVTGEHQQALSLTYGSWQQSLLDGMVNLPLNNEAALRLAAQVENGDGGWQHSLPTGERHGEKQRYDVRSWLHWNLADQWQLDWKVQSGKDDSDIPLGRSIGLYDPDPRAIPGTFCAAVLAGKRDDLHCINFGGVNQVYLGKYGAVENLAQQARDGSTVFSSPLNKQTNDYVSTMLELAWSGPDFIVKSISGIDHFNYGVALDLDGSGGEYGHRIASSEIEALSEELQLLSVKGGKIDWLLGMAISDEDFLEHRDFNLRDNALVGLEVGKLNYHQTTRSQSVYADLSLPLTDQWRLNGNVRYTHEQKHYRDGSFDSPYFALKGLSADYSLDQHLSGSLGVEFQQDAGTLWYGKLSQGFKSGGFFGGFPFKAIEIAPYAAETLLAWEAGVKTNFPKQKLQLNLSAFSYDYRNVQGFVRDMNPLTGTGIDHLANQGDARHYGVEFEANWQLMPQWQLRSLLGWLDARFIKDGKTTLNIAQQQVLIEGQRPYAPHWSGNLQLRHQQSLAAGFQLNWMLSYSFMSDFSGHQPSLVDAAVNNLPGYGKFDASISAAANNSPWQLSVWAKNLTSKIYRTRVKDDGLNSYVEFFGEPRSVGISISYRH